MYQNTGLWSNQFCDRIATDQVIFNRLWSTLAQGIVRILRLRLLEYMSCFTMCAYNNFLDHTHLYFHRTCSLGRVVALNCGSESLCGHSSVLSPHSKELAIIG